LGLPKQPLQTLPIELLAVGGVDYDEAADAGPDETTPPLRPWERRRREELQLRDPPKLGPQSYLPGTEQEARFVRHLYEREMMLPPGTNRIVLLSGREATEEVFCAKAPGAYLIHVATAGFYQPLEDFQSLSAGLRSGLLFAGANQRRAAAADEATDAQVIDDGILTADEIEALPLGNVVLVVLSACETGLGEPSPGEGTIGLQRALHLAGVHTTIGTSWPVPDHATQVVMEEFYRNYLTRRLSPREALRAAQLWALNNPEVVLRGVEDTGAPKVRTPAWIWGAFTLTGDWQ
jgi:CHAT domain-containing protein